jgi:hypothetical protein
MVIGEENVKEIVESQFGFEKVGGAMSGLSKAIKAHDPSAQQTAQERLVKELVKHASEAAGDSSPEMITLLTKAAEKRAQQYADAVKAASSGCGGLSAKKSG